MAKNNNITVSVILFSVIFFALSGCSTSHFGRLESDKEVKRSFESYQILPNHKYYYWGESSTPRAIVGIEETYELNLTMYPQIDTESGDYRRLIDIVSLQGAGNAFEPWGFRILDKTGNYVGVWYSAARPSSVDINENRQIVRFGPSIVVRGVDHR